MAPCLKYSAVYNITNIRISTHSLNHVWRTSETVDYHLTKSPFENWNHVNGYNDVGDIFGILAPIVNVKRCRILLTNTVKLVINITKSSTHFVSNIDVRKKIRLH